MQSFYHEDELYNLKDFIADSVRKYPNNDVFKIKINAHEYSSISYTQLQNEINTLGTAMFNRGWIDCKMAVLGENCYEWVLSYFACVNGGNVIVPLDKELNPADVLEMIEKTQAKVFFFTDIYSDIGQYVKDNISYEINLVNLRVETSNEGFLTLKELMLEGKARLETGERSYLDHMIDDNQLSTIIFTSGTTGKPKGVMLSHKNITTDINAVTKFVFFSTDDVAISVMPIHHTYEFTCDILGFMKWGASIGFVESPKYLQECMKLFKPTDFFTVPLLLETFYRRIIDEAKRNNKIDKLNVAIAISSLLRKVGIDIRRKLFKDILDGFGGKLHDLKCGGAPLDPTMTKKYDDFGVRIVQGYGLTECSPLVSGSSTPAYKVNSLGHVLPCCKVKVVNPNDLTELKPGEIGELLVKGDNVMLGYYEDPQATADAFVDGWFRTGDLGYVESDDSLYLTGRIKNLILLKNGKNVYPEEIENLYPRNGLIKEIIIREGESDNIEAVIYPNPDLCVNKSSSDVFLELTQIIEEVNRGLPYYKHVTALKVRDEPFTKTSTNKLIRSQVQ